MAFILQAIAHALGTSFGMFWEILWPVALGFILSAIIQSLVSRQAVAGGLGTDSPRSLAVACGLGAASSSCSYAAVAIARSLFVKGASFINAIVFEFASTNLAGADPAHPAGLAVPGGRVRWRSADDRPARVFLPPHAPETPG